MELLVALAVAGVVVLGLHAAVRVAADAAAPVDDPARAALRREAARASLRQWLEAAYLPSDTAAFDGRADELSFVTLDPGPLPAPPGTPVRIRIRVAPGRGLVAEYAAASAGAIELVPGARRLRVRYLVRVFDTTHWFEVWSARGRLPRAVELTVYQPTSDADLPLLVTLPGQP